jgi:hypothetical protein
MPTKRAPAVKSKSIELKVKKQGRPVSAMTRVAGKRIGASQRAEQARSQKRRDSKR